MEAPVQEEAYFAPDRPDADAYFAGRAGGDVSAGDGLLQDETHAVADAFSADGAVTGEGEAIIRPAIRTDKDAVTVFAFAQPRLGGDLGLVVGEQGVAPQAGHVDSALSGEGEAMFVDVCAGFV